MANRGYWDKFTQGRVSRRRAMQMAALISGASAGAIAVVGCGGGDDDDGGGQTPRRARRRRERGHAEARRHAEGHRQPGAGQGPAQGVDVPHARAGVVLVQPAACASRRVVGELPQDEWYTPELEVAAKVENPDPLTYIFTLRDDVKLHNLPPVNGRAAHRRRRRLLVQPLPSNLAEQGATWRSSIASPHRRTRRR